MAKANNRESETALAIARGDVANLSKEELISNAMNLGRMAGRIESANMFSKYGNVSALLWLQQVKETKAYKLVGTWPEYCKIIGLDRRKVDEDLSNMAAFGEEFLATVASLGMGYRDLSKLRQISQDGGVKVENGMIFIGGEEIPLDDEHSEELQNTIARIVDDAQGDARAHERLSNEKEKRLKNLTKKLDKINREAEQRGIPEDEAAFAEYMEKVRIGFEGYLLNCTIEAMEEEAEEMTPAKRAQLLNTSKYMRDRAELLYQQVVDKYGQGLTEKSQIWKPGK